MNQENNITLKIKYHSQYKSRIIEYIQNYNNVVRFTYNRLLENNSLKTKELTELQKTMNNIFIDSHFKNSAIFESKSLINKNKKIIFGGKKLFFERMNNKLTKEDYRKQKLIPLCSIGEASKKGNRKFKIENENYILFKPTKNEHFILELESVGKNYRSYLNKLINLQENKDISLTYKLSDEFIYITFDLNKLNDTELKTNKVQNRYFAIDMNPNYVGWAVIDWLDSTSYKIIDSGVLSLKLLNDYDNSLKGKRLDSSCKERKYITNKRQYEVINISHKLVMIANHYKCESFVMEDLCIKSSDRSKGKRFNKLCNSQWCRNIFVNQIKKYCKLFNIQILEVLANYSSFVGNLVYRCEQLPDMCLSSIEISRRGYEWYHQYILKDKNKEKNIVFNDCKYSHNRINQSLEELNYPVEYFNILDLYNKIKKSKTRYRLSFDDLAKSRVFSKIHIKSYQTSYKFV